MPEEVYVRLRQFLDNLPGGFPETDTGVEYKILKRYFTPDEAELAMKLTPVPEAVEVIAERIGADPEELAGILEKMASEGSIYRVRLGGVPYYMSLQFLIGIYEFHLKSMDVELAAWLDEYLPSLIDDWGGVPTKQLRVIPVEAAIDTTQAVSTYDQVRELVKAQERFAVADCICRKEKELLDKGCDHTMESCLTFGLAADYYIENGIGREITLDECLEILERTEKAGMVCSPSNAQAVMNICTCCGDSCNFLRGLKAYERPADHTASNFQASIDPDLCVSCETCVDRCQIEAIIEGDGVMEIDTARCIGCGLCVPTCPESAVAMLPKESACVPPENFIAMQMQIAAERGMM